MASELYQVYSSFTPLIKSGDTAEIDVTEVLSTTDVTETKATGTMDLLHTSGGSVKIVVQGPQTSLTEDDISGVYPAPSSTDSPDNFLPHIALTRRTLPWERRGPADNTVWLALLVINANDLLISESPIGPVAQQVPAQPAATATPAIAALTTVPAAKPAVTSVSTEKAVTPTAAAASGGTAEQLPPIRYSVGSITPQSMQVQDLAKSDPATHTQLLTIPGITDTLQIQAINIPAATLKEILPSAANLGLLCHVKEVVEDSVKTYTSIVVSGRLPDAGDMTTTPPLTHAALLVSLEHRDDVYQRLDKGGAIQLIVLHYWTFVPSKGGDFEEVCQMIGYHPNGGVLRFGNIPSAAANPSTSLSGGFGSLLDNSGYLVTPLDHAEAGNVIWRGPLRPFPPPPRSNGFAVRADPEEFANAPPGAQLDYSHATAFELGRLLAVADASVREDLRQLHMSFNVPSRFVQMSALPPALQQPYWGIDQGQSVDQAETQMDTAAEQPWSLSGSQSMIGLQNAAGSGEVAGFSAAAAQAFQSSVTSVIGAQAPVAAGGATQLDFGSITEAGLAEQFPAVVNAALAGGN